MVWTNEVKIQDKEAVFERRANLMMGERLKHLSPQASVGSTTLAMHCEKEKRWKQDIKY